MVTVTNYRLDKINKILNTLKEYFVYLGEKMYCFKCGFKLPEGSKFCPGCGVKIQANNTESTNTGKCKLIIERMKCFFTYRGMKYNIYIDGKLVKKLSNKETYVIELENGKHNLYVDAFMTPKTTSFEFIGNNNEIKYNISGLSGSDLLGSMNDPNKPLIVNKIYETEPGSYKG